MSSHAWFAPSKSVSAVKAAIKRAQNENSFAVKAREKTFNNFSFDKESLINLMTKISFVNNPPFSAVHFLSLFFHRALLPFFFFLCIVVVPGSGHKKHNTQKKAIMKNTQGVERHIHKKERDFRAQIAYNP